MKRKKNSKKIVEERHQSRRQFLIGTGQMCLTLPPLISLMPQLVLAQAQRKVIRYFCVHGQLGIDHKQWMPVDQSDLTMVGGEESIGYKPLANFSGDISRVIDGSFRDLYPHMNVMSGLSLTGGLYQGHNNSVLAGSHSGAREPVYGKSLDVIIEQSGNVYRPEDAVHLKAIRVIDHGHMNGYSFDRVNGARVITPKLQGDLAVFNSLLSGLAQTNAPGAAQIQSNKKSVVDQVYADLKKLENNKRISSSDKQLLDRYITGLSDLQKKIQSNQSSAPSCQNPSINFQVTGKGNYHKFPSDPRWGITSIDKMYDNYIEMFKIAAMCDQSRVFQVGAAGWDSSLVPGGTAGGLHHEAPSSEIQADRQQYFVKKTADLARALRDTPDPINGGTLLDNSIVFYANELGAWTTSHNTFSMPTITFGSGGGKLTTGNYIDYRQRPLKSIKGFMPGRPYKQLLQAIMMTMGVTKSEYSRFGDGNGFGEFKKDINQFSLSTEAFGRYQNEHNEPLPFFYKG